MHNFHHTPTLEYARGVKIGVNALCSITDSYLQNVEFFSSPNDTKRFISLAKTDKKNVYRTTLSLNRKICFM